MRRELIILCTLLFTLSFGPFVSATETQIYDGWHYSGDTFTVDGEVIYISHFRLSDEKIILSANQKSSSIDLGTCWIGDTKKYCFVEMYNNVSGATSSSKIKFEGRDVYAGLHIKIYKFAKEVTLTRTFTPSTPTVTENIKVEVTITNPTIYSTEGFTYSDIYPEEVIVVSGSSDVVTSLHGVTFKKNIPAQSNKVFSYNIRLQDYIKFTNTASYNYKIADTQISKNTSAYSVDLESLKPYTSTITLSPSSVETGAESELKVSIVNKNADDNLQVTAVSFIVPQTNVSVKSETNNFKSESMGKYSWSGTIDESATKEIKAKLRTLSSGTYKIPIEIIVKEAEGRNYVERKELSFTASYKEPTVILSIKDPTVASGSPFKVALSLKNPNALTSYTDVHGSITSNITKPYDGFKEFILPGTTETLIATEEIYAPYVETETNFPFTVNGVYSTSKGSGKFKAIGNVKVSPINRSLTLVHTVTAPNPLLRGSNVTVAVKAKYANQDSVTVDMKDSFSDGLKLIGGKTFDTVSFSAATEKQAYVYSFFIPLDYEEPLITITTDAVVLGKATTINKITTLEVKDPIVPLETQSPQETNVQQEPIEETQEEIKEQGTVTKILNSTLGFIRRMLGFE